MAQQSEYIIVRSSKDQFINYYNIQEKLQWDPFDNCQYFVEACGAQGCFFGKINGNIISSIIALKYGKYGFIGIYWVKQQFRGKGYGIKIFNKGLEYLKDCDIIGLDAVEQQIQNYQKSGFKTHCNSIKIYAVAPPQNQVLTNKTTLIITDKKDISLQNLVIFDSKHFPSNRISFLQKAIDLGEIIVSQDPVSKQIKGYGIINTIKKAVCLAPLVAQTDEVAQDIIKTMFQKHELYQSLSVCFCDGHKHVQNVVRKWFPLFMYTLTRMYKRNKNDAEIDERCVYALTFQRG